MSSNCALALHVSHGDVRMNKWHRRQILVQTQAPSSGAPKMDALTLELQSLKRECSMLHKQCERAAKRRREKISPWCVEVALVISCMMEYDFRIGVLWLKYPNRRGAPVPDEFSDSSILHEELENRFLVADFNRLTSYLDPPTCQLSATVVKTASRFVLENSV